MKFHGLTERQAEAALMAIDLLKSGKPPFTRDEIEAMDLDTLCLIVATTGRVTGRDCHGFAFMVRNGHPKAVRLARAMVREDINLDTALEAL